MKGLKKRFQRHEDISFSLRKTLKDAGIKLFTTDKHASKTLTSFLLNQGFDAKLFLHSVRKNHKIILAGDLGYVNKQLIRIGHMGLTASSQCITKTLDAIEDSLNALGFNFFEKDLSKIFVKALKK